MCAKMTVRVCTEELKRTVTNGKQILHEISFGCVPASLISNSFAQKFFKAALYLRWLACALFPEVYEKVSALPDKPHPEASVLFYMHAALEDYILEAWETYISRRRPMHFSLRFDGVRVGGLEPGADIKNICQKASATIEAEIGFRMVIVERQHPFLRELCRTLVESVEDSVDAELLKCGNCTPLALV